MSTQIGNASMRRNEQGFTLLEILVTLSIMGVLFVVATASWRSATESRRVTSASNQLAADMRLAHTSATNQLTDWRLVYDDNGDPVTCGTVTADYCLVKVNAAGSPIKRSPRSLPDGTKIIGTNVNPLSSIFAGLFPGSNRALEFNTNGSAEAVGGFDSSVEPDPTIKVGPSGGGTPQKVSVKPATSRVKNAG